MVTADHGCDPGYPTTDHTREYIPIIVYGKNINPVNLGIRGTFADIGKTITDIFGVETDLPGTSFYNDIRK
jgi:phosphopentomutase